MNKKHFQHPILDLCQTVWYINAQFLRKVIKCRRQKPIYYWNPSFKQFEKIVEIPENYELKLNRHETCSGWYLVIFWSVLHASECSTSRPGGNQVDGLPPVPVPICDSRMKIQKDIQTKVERNVKFGINSENVWSDLYFIQKSLHEASIAFQWYFGGCMMLYESFGR